MIGLIAILMLTDLASEGARIATGDLDGSFLPISSGAAKKSGGDRVACGMSTWPMRLLGQPPWKSAR